MTFEWIVKIISDYGPMFIRGAGVTLLISIIGTIVGFIIGLLVGIIRTIPMPERGGKRVTIKIINAILSAYIEFFRGTPMIVQAMVIYYGSALAIGVGYESVSCSHLYSIINTGAAVC